MLPYILAAIGGYLIGDSMKGKTFASGGVIDNELIDKHGGLDDIVSDCCGSKIVNEDICKGCKEHCGRVYVFNDGFSCDEYGVDVENSQLVKDEKKLGLRFPI